MGMIRRITTEFVRAAAEMNRRLLGASALLVLGVGALTSCSAAAQEVQVSGALRGATLQALTTSPDLNLVVQRSAAECMADAGFEFEVEHDPSAGATNNLLRVGGLFESEGTARAGGYPDSIAFNESQESEQSDEYTQALTGDPREAELVEYTLSNGAMASTDVGGCMKRAYEAVYKDLETYLELSYISSEAREPVANLDLSAIPEVSEALKAYGECMTSNGYAVATLAETNALALEDFARTRTANEGPSAQESAMAVTDFRCQQEAQLKETFDGVYFEEAGRWIVENEDSILRWAELQAEAIDRAKGVIEG